MPQEVTTETTCEHCGTAIHLGGPFVGRVEGDSTYHDTERCRRMLVARVASLDAELRRQKFVCPDCGYGVKADEDGCCATCGRDCAVVAVLVEPEDMTRLVGDDTLDTAQGRLVRIAELESALHCGSLACTVTDPGRCFCTCQRCTTARGYVGPALPRKTVNA